MPHYPQASTLVPGSRAGRPHPWRLCSAQGLLSHHLLGHLLSSASPSVGPISSQEAWGPW